MRMVPPSWTVDAVPSPTATCAGNGLTVEPPLAPSACTGAGAALAPEAEGSASGSSGKGCSPPMRLLWKPRGSSVFSSPGRGIRRVLGADRLLPAEGIRRGSMVREELPESTEPVSPARFPIAPSNMSVSDVSSDAAFSDDSPPPPRPLLAAGARGRLAGPPAAGVKALAGGAQGCGGPGWPPTCTFGVATPIWGLPKQTLESSRSCGVGATFGEHEGESCSVNVNSPGCGKSPGRGASKVNSWKSRLGFPAGTSAWNNSAKSLDLPRSKSKVFLAQPMPSATFAPDESGDLAGVTMALGVLATLLPEGLDRSFFVGKRCGGGPSGNSPDFCGWGALSGGDVASKATSAPTRCPLFPNPLASSHGGTPTGAPISL
mmetsp:Transcript_173144/g.555232  ORF Transcript_173144/g.555232 Transcript_173144/m.555232 type:complete len:375 (+) Transcript_173144:1511-2635(+)